VHLTAWPIITDDDIEGMVNVARSGVFTKGPCAQQLASSFAEFVSAAHCQTVSSCTHAIHLALVAAGIGPGDEVLVPDLTYVGSVSPIVNAGATPVFVDVDPDSFNLSIDDALSKVTPATRAILPVHLHGYPCDIEQIRERLPRLVIVEDACQAHGAARDGKFAGTIGDIGCFSLNQVKPLCGGQGGLIVTNDPELWTRVQRLASPGKDDTVGLSYEITEASAALALSQLARLDDTIAIADRNYRAFRSALRDDLRAAAPVTEEGVVAVWHKLRLKLGRVTLEKATGLLEERGVPYETWPGSLVSQRSEYRAQYASKARTPVAESILRETIVLGSERFPFHAQSLSTIQTWADLLNHAF